MFPYINRNSRLEKLYKSIILENLPNQRENTYNGVLFLVFVVFLFFSIFILLLA